MTLNDAMKGKRCAPFYGLDSLRTLDLWSFQPWVHGAEAQVCPVVSEVGVVQRCPKFR
jgi:hypothetical protein